MSNSGVTPLTPKQVAQEETKAAHDGFIKRELVGLDTFANVDLLGGMPDETISSRCARDAAKGYRLGRWMSKFLDLLQRNHGPKAMAGDLERAQAVIATEGKSGLLPSQ